MDGRNPEMFEPIPTDEECVGILKRDTLKGKMIGVSYIQRKFHIGYNRAYRLLEMVVIAGYADREDETKVVFK